MSGAVSGGGGDRVGSNGGGLALERTALAWQRTALAIAVAGVAVGRYTLEAAGALAVVAAVVGVVLASAAALLSARRYRTGRGALGAMRERDGRPYALVAGALVAVGVAGLVALLAG